MWSGDAVEVRGPVYPRNFLGPFLALLRMRKATREGGSLLSGQATFRVAPQRCPLSLPDRPKLVAGKVPHKVYRELQGEGKGEQHGTGLDTFPHLTLDRVHRWWWCRQGG